MSADETFIQKDEYTHRPYSIFFKLALLMLLFLFVHIFIGIVCSVLYTEYQPIFYLNLYDISGISISFHVFVELHNLNINMFLFVMSFIFTVVNIYWLFTGLLEFTSAGLLNSGERTFLKIFDGIIKYNAVYFRDCSVPSFSSFLFVMKHVIGSIILSMEISIFLPRMVYILIWENKKIMQNVDVFFKMFKPGWLRVFTPKFIIGMIVCLDVMLILFFRVTHVPPLHVFVDSPNAFTIVVFIFIICMDLVEITNSARLLIAFLVFVTLANLMTTMNVYNEISTSGTSWLNYTGYYYDLKDEKRVGGFCVYDNGQGNNDMNELLKFSGLQFAYHVTNILFNVAAVMLIPYIFYLKEVLRLEHL